jgi:hypothetical protein
LEGESFDEGAPSGCSTSKSTSVIPSSLPYCAAGVAHRVVYLGTLYSTVSSPSNGAESDFQLLFLQSGLKWALSRGALFAGRRLPGELIGVTQLRAGDEHDFLSVTAKVG